MDIKFILQVGKCRQEAILIKNILDILLLITNYKEKRRYFNEFSVFVLFFVMNYPIHSLSPVITDASLVGIVTNKTSIRHYNAPGLYCYQIDK